MAVETSSNENSKPRSLYLGFANFNVLAINPDLETAKKAGFALKNEPSYIKKKLEDGKEVISLNVSFFLQKEKDSEEEEDITVIHSIYTEYRPVISGDGTKKQYTNVYGQFAYLPVDGTIPENMKWFSTKGMRVAFVGEEILIDFIKNYANVGKDKVCYLEKPQELFRGNYSELREVHSQVHNEENKNSIKILLTVRRVVDQEKNTERYLQSTFNRKHERPYSTDPSYMQKVVEEFKERASSASDITFPEYPYILQKFTPPSIASNSGNATEGANMEGFDIPTNTPQQEPEWLS